VAEMKKGKKFSGIIPPIVTPFDESGILTERFSGAKFGIS
jgi:Dihydrodipicolinate synthase/N-acetylneuraminate lyase